MAQSDSQRSEFEEPDSSNLDSGVPTDSGGEALEPAKIDEPQPVDSQESSPESFGGDVDDLLGGIDIDSDFLVESLELENEVDAEIKEPTPDLVELIAEIAGEIDDSVAAEIRDEVADAFAEEEDEGESVNDSEDIASSFPTPEELLAQAGSILNGADFQLPVEEAEEEPVDEAPADEEDELMAMPDPQSLMNQAGGEEEPEDELMAMPDPQSLMVQASGEAADSEPEKPEEEEIELMAMPDPQALMTAASEGPGEVPDLPAPVVGSNIVDRAGDLPPPPPAPVCLDDGEIFVEEEIVKPKEPEVAKEVVADEPVPETTDEKSEELSEPEPSDDVLFLMDDEDLLAEDSSLDEFNLGSAEADAEEALAESVGSSPETSSHLKSDPPRGVVGRVLQSTALAAGLLLVGLGLTLAFVKEELYGYFQGGGLEGSTLSWHVATIAKQVFDELEETRHYHVNDFSTEISQASDTEVLIEVKMDAHLTSDLYLPVENALIYSQIDFERSDLEAAALFVSEEFPEKALLPPEQPWKKLYQLSSHKGESFPLTANFRLSRESVEEGWVFSKLHVEGGESNLVWGQGEAVDLHDDSSLEVSSAEFQYQFRAYMLAGESYLEGVKLLESQYAAQENERERQQIERRNRLATSLSKGSYFKGMAIAGVDGADAREISMIITETRNEGGLIKGILKLDSDQAHSKHFTGILDIVEREEGEPQALLSLTTVAFEDQLGGDAPEFFRPGTVSRLALKTDGYRMEGDGAEISLRLIRSM